MVGHQWWPNCPACWLGAGVRVASPVRSKWGQASCTEDPAQLGTQPHAPLCLAILIPTGQNGHFVLEFSQALQPLVVKHLQRARVRGSEHSRPGSLVHVSGAARKTHFDGHRCEVYHGTEHLAESTCTAKACVRVMVLAIQLLATCSQGLSAGAPHTFTNEEEGAKTASGLSQFHCCKSAQLTRPHRWLLI